MSQSLQKAIALCGGPTKLSVALGLHKTAAYSWEVCPPERVIAVSELTNWTVTPHQLRPDLYPNPQDAIPPSLIAA